MPRTKVIIVGAAGETGTSITNGLLERATEFVSQRYTTLEIYTAVTRDDRGQPHTVRCFIHARY